ncbi:MAG: Oxidoreductase [Dehalococcoidia bacterium]|nr:Oxidoreductase [Dehalococcoidia bacterium]
MGRMEITATLVPLQVIFWFLFFAYAVKLPIFPFHTWLPDAHTDAPTAVSVILAGVLLKMGGYAIIRVCVTILPQVAQEYSAFLAGLAVVNVVYGAIVTMRQTDLKRLIAYSSISHMGFVLLGISALNHVGLTGAVLQMFTHGTITGLLFALVGLIYDKAHERRVPELGGLAHRMPFIATVFAIAGLASLGLPTMSGFVSELIVFLGTYPVHGLATIIATTGILLTAGYILWMLERTFFRELDPRYEHLGDATWLERVPLVVLVALILLIGLQPALLTDLIQTGVTAVVSRLG